MKKTKGQLLLDDFLHKLDASLGLMSSKPIITLEELRPAWEAREKLEKYLSTPQRDSLGHFLPEEPSIPESEA
jgi:hypothetical protein